MSMSIFLDCLIGIILTYALVFMTLMLLDWRPGIPPNAKQTLRALKTSAEITVVSWLLLGVLAIFFKL